MKDYKGCESAAVRIINLGVTENKWLYSRSVNIHPETNILSDFGQDLAQG